MNNQLNIDETDMFIRDKLYLNELSDFYNKQYFIYVTNEIGDEFDELYDSFGMPMNNSPK